MGDTPSNVSQAVLVRPGGATLTVTITSSDAGAAILQARTDTAQETGIGGPVAAIIAKLDTAATDSAAAAG